MHMSIKSAAVLLCLPLCACGGSGSAKPDNSASKARLSSSNVNTLAADTVSTMLMGVSSAVGPYLMVSNPGSTPMIGTQQGCHGGTATFTLNSAGSNSVSGTGGYSAFDNCLFMLLSGSVAVTGT